MSDYLSRPNPGTPEAASETASGRSGGPVERSGLACGSKRLEHGRDFVDSLLHRSEWLSPGDRQLLHAIYSDGHPVARLAPLLSVGKRTVHRRVKRILERLNSRRFAFVALRHQRWPHARRRVAAATVLQGKSLREAADSLGMSLYSVRRHFDVIVALCEANERPGS